MFAPTYLDANATTRLDPRVLEAMLPHFGGRYGNPSSRHEYGRAARAAVDEARARVAAAVGAHASEVILLGGGTEANNLFVNGVAARLRPSLAACAAIEHPSVREPVKALAGRGWRVREIAVDGEGRVDDADFAAVLGERPALLSVMLANNETGVLQDVAALASAAASSGAWFHSDAVQALGKVPVDFRALNAAGVHALSVSAHKVGGPKGAAALIVDKRVDLAAQLLGGGQERGLRSGTENVAAIVGFGLAAELAVQDLGVAAARLRGLRDELERGLAAQGACIFSAGAERLPNTVYFSIPGLDGETLVGKLDRAGFAVASGAACSSAGTGPSPVLTAMGIESGLARGAVRVSLGRETRAEDIAGFLAALGETVFQLRRLAVLAG